MSGRSRTVALIAAALFVLAPAAEAAAPTLAQITARLRTSAQYDDPSVKVTAAQRAAITTAINDARTKKRIVRVAILSKVPSDAPGATAARRLRARLKLSGTVIVALPASVQIASLNVGGKRLVQARQLVQGKGGFAGARIAINALTAPLAPPTTTTTATTTTTTPPAKSSGGGGVATWIYIAIAAVVLALAAVLTALRIRTRRVRRRGGGNLIEGARALLQGRLDGLGEVLATTAVGVSEREDLALTSHHRNAAETVSEVRSSIGRLDGPPAFRAAHGRLDDAEWHLGVVQAHLAQGGEPPRPESGHPARCFFNAEHGLATVEIELELPGVRTVSVGICAADAVRLSRGDEPEVGAVTVGRRRLPWAAAPTWYGGWGWGQDDLPALRYHGQPVFASSSQLDAFKGATSTGSVSRVRPIAPASDPLAEPEDGELELPAVDAEDEPFDPGMISQHEELFGPDGPEHDDLLDDVDAPAQPESEPEPSGPPHDLDPET
jgi:flagellar basal body-associated protein FliL